MFVGVERVDGRGPVRGRGRTSAASVHRSAAGRIRACRAHQQVWSTLTTTQLSQRYSSSKCGKIGKDLNKVSPDKIHRHRHNFSRYQEKDTQITKPFCDIGKEFASALCFFKSSIYRYLNKRYVCRPPRR